MSDVLKTIKLQISSFSHVKSSRFPFWNL